ncbi:MAG: nucleoside monophosphate kinase [Candidatus Microgenomates bacterium]|jgi:adenylate kinase family enzyme
MKGLEFPVVGTKVPGLTKKFDLNSPEGRKAYFEAKAGPEIAKIKEYLDKKTFVAYLIGKKNSGKGTYSQIFAEIFGADKIALVSIGDIVRNTSANWDEITKTEKYKKLKRIYRGYISFDDAVNALLGRTQGALLPTEFILALLKLEIENHKGKTLFIDGLPRDLDQVSYSLYFRDLIDYRDDPDMFILIDIPESVIDERIKYRVVCPNCKNTRNTKLLITSKYGYDEKKNEFYLVCDSPRCKGGFRMEPKEGDNLGIGPIRSRLDKDEQILRKAFALHGVPKVLLRNHVSVADSSKYFDDYEITPEYSFKLDEGKIKVVEKPWTIKDDNGVESVSLLSAPVVVTMLKQIADILED